jgi:hypothetical protein
MNNQNQIDQELITLRTPMHSDYIMHWTGHDINNKHSIRVNERNYSHEVVDDYLQRLLSILKYGLWLTKRKGDDYIQLKHGENIKKPNIARLCFTELKISDSFLHARNFGSLGIGVKRYFLFNRLGAPMHYVHNTPNLFFPPYSNIFDPSSDDFELVSFFKNMSSGRTIQTYIDYDLYEESEWRIIYSDHIKKKISDDKVKRYFIDPRDPDTGKYHKFYNSLPVDSRPKYLTPLDEWVALIIYPNLQIKNAAYENKEIRQELENLKSSNKVHNRNSVVAEGVPNNEIVNKIVEIDIGAIRHF